MSREYRKVQQKIFRQCVISPSARLCDASLSDSFPPKGDELKESEGCKIWGSILGDESGFARGEVAFLIDPFLSVPISLRPERVVAPRETERKSIPEPAASCVILCGGGVGWEGGNPPSMYTN